MSEQSSEPGSEGTDDGPLSVPDEQLPDDLRPAEDNPLAQPAGDDVPDDILKDTAGDRSGDGSSGGSEDASQGGDDASDVSSGSASSEHEPDGAGGAGG
jgi:hypothetical protein